jgi:hypothetical protein
MTDDTNYTQEVYDIFIKHPGEAQKAIEEIIAKGGLHLQMAVSLGGMFLMVMGEHEYSSPYEVWDAVSNYEDLRNS